MFRQTVAILFFVCALAVFCAASVSVKNEPQSTQVKSIDGKSESVAAFKNMMRQAKPDGCYVCTSPCSRYYCCDGAQCTYYNGNCYCVR